MMRNYHRKFEEKLSQEIMRRNYHRKLSASIYQISRKKCGNYRDTAVSKIKSKRKRGNRCVPLPFRGKHAENCSHNVGKLLGEGLG